MDRKAEIYALADQLEHEGQSFRRGRVRHKKKGPSAHIAASLGVSQRYVQLVLASRRKRILDDEAAKEVQAERPELGPPGPRMPEDVVASLRQALEVFLQEAISMDARCFPSELVMWADNGVEITSKARCKRLNGNPTHLA